MLEDLTAAVAGSATPDESLVDAPSVEEAYAALVAAASGSADAHDRQVLERTPDDLLGSFVAEPNRPRRNNEPAD